jgi:hypothetical protein
MTRSPAKFFFGSMFSMAIMMPQSADFFHEWGRLVAQASAGGFWY